MPPSAAKPAIVSTNHPQRQGALHRCRESLSIKAEVILVMTQLPTYENSHPIRCTKYTPLFSSVEDPMGYRFSEVLVNAA